VGGKSTVDKMRPPLRRLPPDEMRNVSDRDRDLAVKDVLSASLASSKIDRSVITSSSSAQIGKSTFSWSYNAWL
jgi:hypothetical protein